MSVIKSISYNQEEIIQDILTLHSPNGIIDCDPTYSKGIFYKNLDAPKLKFDINPVVPGVIQSDCCELPIKNNSLSCIMFDPPFLWTSGPSLKKTDKSNIITKRFSYFKNAPEIFKFYYKALIEFNRILHKNGILIFKCQDTISGGSNHFSHNIIMNQALEIGYYPKDLFILLAKSRLISGKHKNQKHCRKFHSYFWVFEKRNSKVKYKELTWVN